ncbi:MAG: hypothetical protein DWQ44_13080 [Bacteroidetes bacterium]|nr:MAG: hypothetical protein DWQ33_13465 [Bacteroidota bacterium]REK05797.1 MAG: hypothetical protein DWQ39_05170 [Bacteroidota bacterium]REK31898.1 MAG: hypothetical protein DWQ44_13080 [Bacteroidota bacterium]REK49963.1 MAG: hypothetical protein DWQ48_05300 [Bacteroidota bacterium]
MLMIYCLLGALSFISCENDSIEELYPLTGQAACDTAGVISFSSQIRPILNNSCGAGNNCHSTGNTSSGIALDNYAEILATVTDGSLLGSILHQSGYEPMPDGGGMLDQCSIAKFQKWINNGSPNN